MKFPKLSEELIQLLDEDQAETKEFFREYNYSEPKVKGKKRAELSERCRSRAKKSFGNTW